MEGEERIFPYRDPNEIAEAREAARMRTKRENVKAPKVRVVHPGFGEAIVPGRSKFHAICEAAEGWGCDWAALLQADVWAIEGREA